MTEKNRKVYYSSYYESPLGELLIVSDRENIVGLWFSGEKYFLDTINGDIKRDDDSCIIRMARDWLDRYFEGNEPDISEIPLKPSGSEFRRIVWSILTEIPYGKTVTYRDVASKTAERMGRKSMSSQAIGGAVGHNPISVIIPCHRVIGSSGSLTGYAGGIERKKKLLELEGVDTSLFFIPEKGTAL